MSADAIEINRGHEYGDNFFIVPIVVKDRSKPSDWTDNVEEYSKYEITIKEDAVSALLHCYLKKYFNPEIEENKNRSYAYGGNVFEWYCENNYFSFNDIEKIVEEIKMDIELIIKHRFEDEKRMSDVGEYLYYYLKKKESECFIELFWKYQNVVIDFYRQFNIEMKRMINAAKRDGYTLISFSGP